MIANINTDQYGVEQRARYLGLKYYFELRGFSGKQLRDAIKAELQPQKVWN
jgi:hypothetical protein